MVLFATWEVARFVFFLCNFSLFYYTASNLFSPFIPEHILREVRATYVAATQSDAAANSHTTKDDIICLMHLIKEPIAQRHWSNLNGMLKWAELDARKSDGKHSETENPLDCLAKLFNGYEYFRPKKSMVQYVRSGSHKMPVKKQL